MLLTIIAASTIALIALGAKEQRDLKHIQMQFAVNNRRHKRRAAGQSNFF